MRNQEKMTTLLWGVYSELKLHAYLIIFPIASSCSKEEKTESESKNAILSLARQPFLAHCWSKIFRQRGEREQGARLA
jgi:hypothetical protein